MSETESVSLQRKLLSQIESLGKMYEQIQFEALDIKRELESEKLYDAWAERIFIASGFYDLIK